MFFLATSLLLSYHTHENCDREHVNWFTLFIFPRHRFCLKLRQPLAENNKSPFVKHGTDLESLYYTTYWESREFSIAAKRMSTCFTWIVKCLTKNTCFNFNRNFFLPSSTLKKRVLCKNVKDVVESRASPTISMKTYLLGPIDSSSPWNSFV